MNLGSALRGPRGLLRWLSLLAAGVAASASAETAIVPCAADTTLIESATGALRNGAGPDNSALFRFDFADLPAHLGLHDAQRNAHEIPKDHAGLPAHLGLHHFPSHSAQRRGYPRRHRRGRRQLLGKPARVVVARVGLAPASVRPRSPLAHALGRATAAPPIADSRVGQEPSATLRTGALVPHGMDPAAQATRVALRPKPRGAQATPYRRRLPGRRSPRAGCTPRGPRPTSAPDHPRRAEAPRTISHEHRGVISRER
jgi:hypothetical protein